jgi:small subunit ribosomal protein S4
MKNMTPKYKICYRTNENIWNDENIYSLKKKKWSSFLKLRKKHRLVTVGQTSTITTRPKSTKQLYKHRLLARQSFKNFYGGLTNKYVKILFGKLKKQNSSNIILRLLTVLESRIDIVLYRLGIVNSIFEAKQLIQHKKILVNDQTQYSKNYILKKGDLITIISDKHPLENISKVLSYTEINSKLNMIVFLRQPLVTEIYYPFKIQPNLIFEYFNKS